MVKVGDSIPTVPLEEGAPGNTINLAEELGSGSGIIIGVPAAFSPTCSDSHVPGYLAHPKLKSAGKVFVVAVNDPFVTKAWGKSLDKDSTSGIRFLADSSGAFARAWDVEFPAAPKLGTNRSKRYAVLVEGGKVTRVEIEPDNTGASVSLAENVLG